jgi:predicted RNase H-like nuclease (RuvC/YqgF family)
LKQIAIIEASITFESLTQSLQISIDDIKKKNAHRTDLIESMQKHLDFLQDARTTFNILVDENKQYQTLLYSEHKKVMELSREVEQLKKINNNLTNGI